MDSKSVIVTGSSSGLGRHITRRLVADGHRVVAVARRAERLDELASELSEGPGSVVTAVADVTDPEAVDEVVSTALDEFGGIDVLVNNAGMEIQGPIDVLELEELESMLATNVLAPVICTRAALPHLRSSQGAVINIGSTVVSRPPKGRFGYVASKGGLEAMSLALAGDLGTDGIRVNVVRPGIVPSELRGSSEEAEREALAARVPGLQALQDVGDGSNVAGAVAYLVSEDGRWVTGAVIDVDGGYSLGVIH